MSHENIDAMAAAREILQKFFGYTSFRPTQEQVIRSILEKKDTLAIMPTGAGKSLCYQIPALIGEGVTVVVSPLISLMKDQVDALNNQGVAASYINGTISPAEANARLNEAAAGLCRILYVAPERLLFDTFIEKIRRIKIAMVAVDEAHCLSQWGHDFRRSYLDIAPFVEKLPTRPVVAAFTATATPEVKEDIIKLLRLKSPAVYVGGFDRPNLFFAVRHGGAREKKKFIVDYLNKHRQEAGIIYASTRKNVEKLCEFLTEKRFSVNRYHAGLTDEERTTAQENFIYDRVRVIVATNAFGMGIDKSNVRYVIHFNCPKNMESYYQEAGRAGRDGERAECILLFSEADISTCRYLIESSTDDEERKEHNLSLLDKMTSYANTAACLRKYMLGYFGEETEPCQNNCDNCLDMENKTDITVDSQKILSCILRMKKLHGFNYGASLITKVLRGSKSKRVSELKFDELSTYGLMKEYTRDYIKNVLSALSLQGYVQITRDEYPVVNLLPPALDVLRGKVQVVARLPQEIKIADMPEDDISKEMFEALRILRKNIADREDVPPYMVFSDATLRDMVRVMPKSLDEMRTVSGIGDYKLKKYGDEFLAAILS